jgi:hypothetical protein
VPLRAIRISKSPQNGGFQLITGGKVFDFIAALAAAAIPSALGVLAFLLFITYKKPFFSLYSVLMWLPNNQIGYNTLPI